MAIWWRQMAIQIKWPLEKILRIWLITGRTLRMAILTIADFLNFQNGHLIFTDTQNFFESTPQSVPLAIRIGYHAIYR
jgi:hypothetical protein